MIEIGAKIAKKICLKKSKRPSVYRSKIAISPNLLCYILLRFMARDINWGEGGPIFLPKFEGINEPKYKFTCNIKNLAFRPSKGSLSYLSDLNPKPSRHRSYLYKTYS